MNAQRIAKWSLVDQTKIITDKPFEFNGMTDLIGHIPGEVAKIIIADHEFCQSLTENDRDRMADMLWWMKGYKKGSDNSFSDCPFVEEHLEVLRKLVTTWPVSK